MDSEIKIPEWRFVELIAREKLLMECIPFSIDLITRIIQSEDEQAATDTASAAKMIAAEAERLEAPFYCYAGGPLYPERITYMPNKMDAVPRVGHYTVFKKSTAK